jgi:hypothetical protein
VTLDRVHSPLLLCVSMLACVACELVGPRVRMCLMLHARAQAPHTHTHTHTRTRTHTHTHTHTHTQARTHARTHTHTFSDFLSWSRQESPSRRAHSIDVLHNHHIPTEGFWSTPHSASCTNPLLTTSIYLRCRCHLCSYIYVLRFVSGFNARGFAKEAQLQFVETNFALSR